MTRLLVSVRSAAEAQDALAGGADIIDVKEPHRGSLGRADAVVVREIVEMIDGRAPVSVALGELDDCRSVISDFDLGHVSFAKVGLAKCSGSKSWQDELQHFWKSLPVSVSPVAVVYADWQQAEAPSPEAILGVAHSSSVRYVLVDTFRKTAGCLLDHWPLADLRRFADQAHAAGCRLVLAGSLDSASILEVLPLLPWAIAVRGAVCAGTREATLSRDAVRDLKDFLRRET